MESFKKLGLEGEVLEGIKKLGFETPTPIQEQEKQQPSDYPYCKYWILAIRRLKH